MPWKLVGGQGAGVGVGGGVVNVQEGVGGRVRHGGVGRGGSLVEWEGGDVRRIVRGGDAIAGGDGEAAAPGGDLPERDGVELSRRVDVSGRGVRAVVQRIVVERTGGKHDAAAGGKKLRCAGPNGSGAPAFLPRGRTAFRRRGR